VATSILAKNEGNANRQSTTCHIGGPHKLAMKKLPCNKQTGNLHMDGSTSTKVRIQGLSGNIEENKPLNHI